VAKPSGQARAGLPWRALTFAQAACCAHALGAKGAPANNTCQGCTQEAEAGGKLQSLLTLTHCACARLCRLVSALALCAAAAAAGEASADGSVSADAMAKVLAGIAFLKEMGNFDNAKHAMSLFSKVADAHVAEARPQWHRRQGGAGAEGGRRAACSRRPLPVTGPTVCHATRLCKAGSDRALRRRAVLAPTPHSKRASSRACEAPGFCALPSARPLSSCGARERAARHTQRALLALPPMALSGLYGALCHRHTPSARATQWQCEHVVSILEKCV